MDGQPAAHAGVEEGRQALRHGAAPGEAPRARSTVWPSVVLVRGATSHAGRAPGTLVIGWRAVARRRRLLRRSNLLDPLLEHVEERRVVAFVHVAVVPEAGAAHGLAVAVEPVPARGRRVERRLRVAAERLIRGWHSGPPSEVAQLWRRRLRALEQAGPLRRACPRAARCTE